MDGNTHSNPVSFVTLHTQKCSQMMLHNHTDGEREREVGGGENVGE